MRRRHAVVLALILCAGSVGAQELTGSGATVAFRFADRSIVVPRLGARVEIMPVLAMMGAEAAYSPAAETYGVVYQRPRHPVRARPQVRTGRRRLQEAPDVPTASPGGVAASVAFLEQILLAPMGYHLEPLARGYLIAPGARFADPVTVRPAAADFGSTTTLVLTVTRPVEVAVERRRGRARRPVRRRDAADRHLAAVSVAAGGLAHGPRPGAGRPHPRRRRPAQLAPADRAAIGDPRARRSPADADARSGGARRALRPGADRDRSRPRWRRQRCDRPERASRRRTSCWPSPGGWPRSSPARGTPSG